MGDRFRQIQGCRRPRLTTVQGNETPQAVVSWQPSVTESTKHTIDSLAISLSDPVPAFTDPGHATVLKDDEAYLGLFDLFTNNDGSQETDKSLLDTGHHLLSPVYSIGSVVSHPPSPFRADCAHVQSSEAADQINTRLPEVPSVCASFDVPDASQMLPLVLTPFDVGSDCEIRNSAALDERLSLRSHINSCSSEKKIRKQTRVDLQLPTLQGQSEDSTLLENTTMISSYAQDNRKSSKDSADDLSPLINHLSNSSSSQTKLIEDILTVSSHSSKNSTRSSGSSTRSMGSSSLSLETTLMARVRSEASENLEFSELIAIETDTTINQRNARGETALHLSVKLGNINATKALLRSSANVHATDSRGRGILAVAERAQRRRKNDESLYARIAACMALAIDSGAVAAPVVMEEHHIPPLAQRYSGAVAAPVVMEEHHIPPLAQRYSGAVAAPVVMEERHMPPLAQRFFRSETRPHELYYR